MVPSTMANQTYSTTVTGLAGNQSWQTVSHKDTSVSSPKKPSGGLALRPNPHDWDHRTSSVPRVFPGPTGKMPQLARMDSISLARYSNIEQRPEMIRITNEALARFTGKVRKHNANLGVTLASWKQSADMIGGASKKIAGILDRRIREVEKMSPERRRRIRVQGTAGAFLGVEFGWIPLVDDIKAGIGTLARSPPDSQWIRSVSKTTTSWKDENTPPTYSTWLYVTGREDWKCTVSGRVKVESQNLFLANRMGLLNLPGVAWDLVPWSFVVNMFTNMGQMVNSMTDFVGVTIDASSTTKSVFADISERVGINPAYAHLQEGTCECEQLYKKRVRSLGVPSPKFQWRVPELNLELVAILAALPLQRINKLNRLVGYKP